MSHENVDMGGPKTFLKLGEGGECATTHPQAVLKKNGQKLDIFSAKQVDIGKEIDFWHS